MADTTKIANNAASAEADALAGLLDNGYLRIYDSTGGTGQPATADTAIGSQVLLAELRFANPSDAGASNGVITFSAITADSAANATGTATWFRAFKSDGTTPVWDGSVGTSGATLNLNSVAIQSGAEVSVTSLTFTVNKG
jgi:hypothetical protein